MCFIKQGRKCMRQTFSSQEMHITDLINSYRLDRQCNCLENLKTRVMNTSTTIITTNYELNFTCLKSQLASVGWGQMSLKLSFPSGHEWDFMIHTLRYNPLKEKEQTENTPAFVKNNVTLRFLVQLTTTLRGWEKKATATKTQTLKHYASNIFPDWFGD